METWYTNNQSYAITDVGDLTDIESALSNASNLQATGTASTYTVSVDSRSARHHDVLDLGGRRRRRVAHLRRPRSWRLPRRRRRQRRLVVTPTYARVSLTRGLGAPLHLPTGAKRGHRTNADSAAKIGARSPLGGVVRAGRPMIIRSWLADRPSPDHSAPAAGRRCRTTVLDSAGVAGSASYTRRAPQVFAVSCRYPR